MQKFIDGHTPPKVSASALLVRSAWGARLRPLADVSRPVARRQFLTHFRHQRPRKHMTIDRFGKLGSVAKISQLRWGTDMLRRELLGLLGGKPIIRTANSTIRCRESGAEGPLEWQRN